MARALVGALACLLLALAVSGHAAAHLGVLGPGVAALVPDQDDQPAQLHTEDHFGKRRRTSLDIAPADTGAGDACSNPSTAIASLRVAVSRLVAAAPRRRLPRAPAAHRSDPTARLRRGRGPPAVSLV